MCTSGECIYLHIFILSIFRRRIATNLNIAVRVRRNIKFINNTIPLALASLCISFAADQEVVPQGNCNFLKQAQCAVAATSIVADITTLPIPPSLEESKAVLVNGNAFFHNCKECLYESQTNLICVTIDRVVTESSKTLKIDVDFHLESCKKEGVIGAIKDTLGSIGSLLPFTEEDIVDGTTKALVDFGIDQSEARSIAEENLSLLSGEIVNPIRDGCVKVFLTFSRL